jgi:hypothetical protein
MALRSGDVSSGHPAAYRNLSNNLQLLREEASASKEKEQSGTTWLSKIQTLT